MLLNPQFFRFGQIKAKAKLKIDQKCLWRFITCYYYLLLYNNVNNLKLFRHLCHHLALRLSNIVLYLLVAAAATLALLVVG